ncbi:hypothetical protein [Natronococcus roseus]|uniref:hypothetical protein n=1 Tax=Natronococcus roseus TaxID=1052014 RepID=UPI00374D1665
MESEVIRDHLERALENSPSLDSVPGLIARAEVPPSEEAREIAGDLLDLEVASSPGEETDGSEGGSETTDRGGEVSTNPQTESPNSNTIADSVQGANLQVDEKSPDGVGEIPCQDREYERNETNQDSNSKPEWRECFETAIEWFGGQIDRDIRAHGEHGEHPDRPSTAREYYKNRGWDDETIEAKKLGYAPANDGALVSHLLREGYDKQTIRATGLFSEGMGRLWTGRYVMPYLDENGEAVYAIARETAPSSGEERHPADGMQGKYAKPMTTAPYVRVEEPIYGQQTLDWEGPVLITEGIADAITAHEAGYPCLSPVTKEFKREHYEPLVDLLEDHDVDQVFLVQDSEAPGSSIVDRTEAGGDVGLEIDGLPPGLEGAVKTAKYLEDNGLDARVAEVPRHGLRKVDLDDYVQWWTYTPVDVNPADLPEEVSPADLFTQRDEEGGECLGPILRSARPASDHWAADRVEYDRQRVEREITEATTSDVPGADKSTEGGSALWDLEITDVCRFGEGDRGKNPLGHTGDSENYFVVTGEGTAYDFKRNVAYTALSFLAVEAGERSVSDPNGEFSDEEIFETWRHAKDRGHIAADDPIPRRALVHVATDDLGISDDPADLPDGWRIPNEAWNDALEHVEEEYGADPGRHEQGSYDDDREPQHVSAIPTGELDSLSIEERREQAAEEGLEWPTTDEVRDRLENAIVNEMRANNMSVIDAPTSAGKSHTIATTPWLNRANVTDERPVIHFHATREARDQAFEASKQAGVSTKKIKGRNEACPVSRGEFDDELSTPPKSRLEDVSRWFKVVCDDRGIPFSTAHKHLEQHNDGQLPCTCEGEECEAIAQWENIPTDDDGIATFDVLHATNQFMHVPSLRRYTNMLIDELPDFTNYSITDDTGGAKGRLSQERIKSAVGAYLREIDTAVTSWDSFVRLAEADDLSGTDAAFELDQVVSDLQDEDAVGKEWYFNDPNAHVLAPSIARAVFYALNDDSDSNGRYQASVTHTPPRLDQQAHDSDMWNQEYVSVVIDEERRIRKIRQVPSLQLARSVIGLDAHPTMELWQLNIDSRKAEYRSEVDLVEILDRDERRLWRQYERGLQVVQVGTATRTLSSDYAAENYFDEAKTRALIEHLHAEYESFSTCVTTSSVESKIVEIMEETGITIRRDEDGVQNTMHYGEEKSRGDFGDEDIGLVNGCVDPGDDYVYDILAEYNSDASAERRRRDVECGQCDGDGCRHCECSKCEGDGCFDCNETGLARAKGRGFVGEDVDTAESILASVRENHVAQAAGRYARNAGDRGDTARVFVRTDAVPDGFVDVQVPGVEKVFTDKQALVVETLRSSTRGVTAREISDTNDISNRQARRTLNDLSERGIAVKDDSGGATTPTVYTDGGRDVPRYGIVMLNPGE